MSRHYSRSDVEVDRGDDRRGTYVSRDGGRRYDDRATREEIDFKRGSGPLPPTRERDVLVRERSSNRGPEYLREDYGRSNAGPMILRAREREDFEFAPRPRRRSPSPEPPKQEKEEIIIRSNERSESRGPPVRRDPSPSREREEIIIRRDEREREPARPPPRREPSREREEIIIRRDEHESRSRGPPIRREPSPSREREEIIIRRDETDARSRYDDDVVSRRSYRPPPGRGDRDREEIIIRREEVEDDRQSRISTRRYDDDLGYDRPKSHERARSRMRSSSSASQEEIIIRRDEREGGRGGDRERQEIIIRRSSRSRSRSPSPVQSVRPSRAAPAEPPIIYAPQIHQEVITHHRHIDHGYDVALAPRPISRPPSPPSPPQRERSQERIEISRSGTRNGRSYDEDIIIDRNEGARSVPPGGRDRERDYYPPPARREPSPFPPGYRPGWEDRAAAEEAEYYNDRAMTRGYPGEAYHGSTRNWGLVDVPPGTQRVRMDGVGGGSQEITWQRYNGTRRSKFLPDGDLDPGYGSELARPPPPGLAPDAGAGLGARYGARRDPRDGLWTEVTKDLVVKEAIQEMGYEYEETDEFYYIFRYMSYGDMARLVGLSEDIRKDRHKRIREMDWENRVDPTVGAIEGGREPLAIEAPPGSSSSRDQKWNRDEERYIEREVVYRGGRPPPPVGWRR